MSTAWPFIKKYVLNIDTILALCIIILVIYFIYNAKPKKYKFKFPTINGNSHNLDGIYNKKRKKKKRYNKHEEECRRIFQEIFQTRFKSCRPDWLKNPVTGKNLELDGFNEEITTPLGLGLAFEYDGKQHAEFNSHFHKNGPEEFVYQVKKDSWKDLKCKERNVVLIRIPHFVHFNDLNRYIRQEITRHKVVIPHVEGGYMYRGGGQGMYG